MPKCVVAVVTMLDIPHKAGTFPLSTVLLKREAVERRGQHYSHSPTSVQLHQIRGSFLSCGSGCCQGSP
ncbi:hypothetical protein LINPERPRIM_LOCUS23667 [Linum perenne]